MSTSWMKDGSGAAGTKIPAEGLSARTGKSFTIRSGGVECSGEASSWVGTLFPIFSGGGPPFVESPTEATLTAAGSGGTGGFVIVSPATRVAVRAGSAGAAACRGGWMWSVGEALGKGSRSSGREARKT